MSRQGDEYMVASATHGCELARVPCGPWRRPLAFTAPSPAAPASFALAYVQDRAIQIRRRRPPPPPPPPAQPPLLPLPGSAAAAGARERSATGACAQQDLCSDSGGGVHGLGGVSATRCDNSGSGGAQPRSLHMAHHGLDVTCVLLLPLGPVMPDPCSDPSEEDSPGHGSDSGSSRATACALAPRRERVLGLCDRLEGPGSAPNSCESARAGTLGTLSGGQGSSESGRSSHGAGATSGLGRSMNRGSPALAVLTGSDDGTVRRLLLSGACDPGPGSQPLGCKRTASNPDTRASGDGADRDAGAAWEGASRLCAHPAPGGPGCEGRGCTGAWGSEQVGVHAVGTTVKALAAVPWPPGSGALKVFMQAL